MYWDFYDDYACPEIAAASHGELIVVWMSYIERGVFAVDPEGGWAGDLPELPDDVVKRGIW